MLPALMQCMSSCDVSFRPASQKSCPPTRLYSKAGCSPYCLFFSPPLGGRTEKIWGGGWMLKFGEVDVDQICLSRDSCGR